MKKSKILNEAAIKEVEEKYNAKFVADLPLPLSDNRWSQDFAGAVFYVESPDKEKRHSHYFALYYDPIEKKLFITNAEKQAEHPITAALAVNGELVYSSYCHDYRKSKDGTAIADGGFDYFRGSTKTKTLWIVKDKLMYSGSPLMVMEEVIYDDEGLMYARLINLPEMNGNGG